MAYDVCHAKFSYEMYECSHPWCMTRYSTTLLFLDFSVYWQRYAFLVNLSNDAWLTKVWSMEAVNSMKTEQVMNTYIIKICMISHLQCSKHSEMILQQSCFCLCSHQSRRWVVCTGKRSRENKADCCCVAFLVLVTCLSWKNTSFVMAKICLLWQNFCCNKIMFVATNMYCLSLVCHEKTHLLSWQKYACYAKTFVATKLCLLQQTHVCHDKTFVATNICRNQNNFVTTKMVLVAVPASDSEDQLCLFILYLKHCLLCFSISDRDTPAHTCGLNVCSHGSVRVAVKVIDSCANASGFINSSLHLKMSSPPLWNSAHQNDKFVHLSQGAAVGGGVSVCHCRCSWHSCNCHTWSPWWCFRMPACHHWESQNLLQFTLVSSSHTCSLTAQRLFRWMSAKRH